MRACCWLPSLFIRARLNGALVVWRLSKGEKSHHSVIVIYIKIDIDILINGLADHADTAFWGSVRAQARPSIDGSLFPLARKPPRQGDLWWRQGAQNRKTTKELNVCGQTEDIS
jgi:hypothetical protein